MLDTEKKIVKVASHVDIFLKNYLKKRTENTKLFNALKYGLFSGGKKFRSYLIVTSGKLFNLNYKQLIHPNYHHRYFELLMMECLNRRL